MCIYFWLLVTGLIILLLTVQTYQVPVCIIATCRYILGYVYFLINQTIQSIIKEKCYCQNINCLNNLLINFYHYLSVSMQRTRSDKTVKRAFWLITYVFSKYTFFYNVCRVDNIACYYRYIRKFWWLVIYSFDL